MVLKASEYTPRSDRSSYLEIAEPGKEVFTVTWQTFFGLRALGSRFNPQPSAARTSFMGSVHQAAWPLISNSWQLCLFLPSLTTIGGSFSFSLAFLPIICRLTRMQVSTWRRRLYQVPFGTFASFVDDWHSFK
jgi:hypothetical protein